MNATHRLTTFDKGAQVWARCSCNRWAWLGTYFGDRGRAAELRRSHAAHVVRDEAAESVATAITARTALDSKP